MQAYEVLHGSEKVGKAEITTQGLYYCISCVLNLPHNTVYRLSMLGGDKRLALGVCVPEGDSFVLKKRIPMKHFDISNGVSFFVDTRNHTKEARKCPLNPYESFTEISKLGSARFEMQQGVGYILF